MCARARPWGKKNKKNTFDCVPEKVACLTVTLCPLLINFNNFCTALTENKCEKLGIHLLNYLLLNNVLKTSLMADDNCETKR